MITLSSYLKPLPFTPSFFLRSPHLQTLLGYLIPVNASPPSVYTLISVDATDQLSCEISTPLSWTGSQKTIMLIHGLTGSAASSYVVRFALTLYQKGYRVVRVNMRGCDPNKSLAKRPYHGGLSQDIHQLLLHLKQQMPASPITLIGFSISGNIVLKLAGELGEAARGLVEKTVAICPPINLARCSALLLQSKNSIYTKFFVKNLRKNCHPAINDFCYSTVYEFDDKVVTSLWNFEGAADYHQKNSSCFLLSKICHPCYVLFAADDPFIDCQTELNAPPSPFVQLFITRYGGHLGFFGEKHPEHGFFWMNKMLLHWVEEAVT